MLGRDGHPAPQCKQRHCGHSPSHPQPPGTGTELHSVCRDTAATHHYAPGGPRWSTLGHLSQAQPLQFQIGPVWSGIHRGGEDRVGLETPGTGTELHSVCRDTAATHHYAPGGPLWSSLGQTTQPMAGTPGIIWRQPGPDTAGQGGSLFRSPSAWWAAQ